MKKINFEDGQLVTAGYVEIDGVQHSITEAVYEGETPLSSFNLNNMQDNIEEAINEKADTTTATQEADGLMSKDDKVKLDNMPNIIDDLESESTTDALSANQGKILNDKIANIISKSVSGSEMCVKFDNGMMMVFGTSDSASFTEAGNVMKTIDISKYDFIGLVSATATAQVSYADTTYCDFVVYVHSKSKDAVNYQIWNKYPSNIGIYINYMIIGVWK